MMRARFADMLTIWERDDSRFPQSGSVTGFIGCLLRIKCSICILLGREGDGYDYVGDGYDYVPVWIGPMFIYGNNASWSEVGVKWGWRDWQYRRYSNGI